MHDDCLPARDPVRARQVTAARWLVSISVGSGLLSGTVSVITGLNGHSLSVLAVGLGVLADVTGSATLIWRHFEDREVAAPLHGDTPFFGEPVTSGSVTPYTTSVDVNSGGGPS